MLLSKKYPPYYITFIASSNAFWWPFQCLFTRSIWAPPLIDRYYGLWNIYEAYMFAYFFSKKNLAWAGLFNTSLSLYKFDPQKTSNYELWRKQKQKSIQSKENKFCINVASTYFATFVSNLCIYFILWFYSSRNM